MWRQFKATNDADSLCPRKKLYHIKNAVKAIAFDPYTHGYYKVGERVGDAFKDGLQLK